MELDLAELAVQLLASFLQAAAAGMVFVVDRVQTASWVRLIYVDRV